MWYLKHFPIGKIGLITAVSSEAMGGVFCVTAEGDLCAVTALLSSVAVRIRLAVQHELEQFNVTFLPHLISFPRVKTVVNKRRGFQLINCSILFVIKEMFYLSCWWPPGTRGGGAKWLGQGGVKEKREQLLYKHMWGQTLASTLYLSSSPCHSQTLTKIL